VCLRVERRPWRGHAWPPQSARLGEPLIASEEWNRPEKNNKSERVSSIVQGAGPNVEGGRIRPAGRSLGTTDLDAHWK